MKKINIFGDRQVGKTTMLVNSIFTHLTDQSLPDNFSMVVSAPSIKSVNTLRDLLIEKLTINKVSFEAKENMIVTKRRICRFLPPTPTHFIGKSFDYVFLDNVDHFSKDFLGFIDMVIRPSVVVVQTQGEDSPFFKDVPVK